MAERHDPPPLAFISHGLQRNFFFFYSIIHLSHNKRYVMFLECLRLEAEEDSANMFYTCGPNEAMVVSGNVLAVRSCDRSKVKHFLKFA